MKIKLIPTLALMEEIYLIPIGPDRFKKYLAHLHGDTTNDLAKPILGFNPMGQEYVLKKLIELKSIDAEGITKEIAKELSFQYLQFSDVTLTIGLNLADDKNGGWTQRNTTDFESKFRIRGLVNRGFCAPYFWTSEEYNHRLVRSRIYEYALRSIYRIKHAKMLTLEDHLNQEIFVAKSKPFNTVIKTGYKSLENFFEKYKSSHDYHLIFNFFYGDKAALALNYPTLGLKSLSGFDFARMQATK